MSDVIGCVPAGDVMHMHWGAECGRGRDCWLLY
jgi:hypothetical protein